MNDVFTWIAGFIVRMSKLSIRCVAGSAVFVLVYGWIVGLTPIHAAAATPDARAVMSAVYRQDSGRDASFRATLDVFEAHGGMLRKRFVLFKKGALGHSKTLVRFTAPAEIRGVALLSIRQTGEADGQWIYLPATDRVRPVTSRERSERFAGSDLTYEDVVEPALDDFNYRFLSDAEIMDGHKTYKIEAVPASPDRSQYKLIYYWVAQDVPVILHAEKYDPQGRLVRTMHFDQLKKVSGIVGARRLEIRTTAENTRTVLTFDQVHFDSRLEDSIFSPDALRSVPPKAR